MKLTLYPYHLKFKYPFKIAHGSRTGTDVVYVKLEHDGFTGWGEATLPPYLPETTESVVNFIQSVEQEIVSSKLDPPAIFKSIDIKRPGNLSAKAALDMALWNLKAAIENKSLSELLEIKAHAFPLGTYTLGVSEFEEMQMKVNDAVARGFKLFKLKLDGDNDEAMLRNYRQLSVLPFAVDVNQGWKDVADAARKIKWLKDHDCIFVEQPLSKVAREEMVELKKLSTLPLFADEACQRLSDLENIKTGFDGVNIKLMKCGGVTEAFEMIKNARELNLKVLIGCMSESSVGCTTAAHLTPLADYADLDGPYLNANDPFEGMLVEDGRIKIHPLKRKEELTQIS